MKKLDCMKARLTFWRVLKVIMYVCGYPLFHYFARLAIQAYPGGQAGSAQFALDIINYVWIGLAVVQILMMLITKRTMIRALVVAIFAAVVMCAPIAYIQVVVKDNYNEDTAALKEETGYEAPTWEEMYFDYTSEANSYNALFSDYCNYYNISYNSKVKGGENTDGSDYTYDAEDDAYYSENGLFADGYIFGYKQARYIHETYIAYRAKCEAEGVDADVKLATAIAELEANPYSEWNKYKKTDEYQAAYGENGTALKYYVNDERLDEILSALGRELSETKLMDEISGILSVLGGVIPEDIPVEDILAIINEDLSLEKVDEILTEMDLGVTADDIVELLRGYSFYQSPSTKPVFMFIEDEELREYARVTYEGKTHGAAVGSVLIGEKVGEVTLSESGNEAKTDEELTKLFAKIDAKATYVPTYAPYFTFIEYLYYFAGVVPCAFILSYIFSEIEKRSFKKHFGK